MLYANQISDEAGGGIFLIIPTNVAFTVVDNYIQAENNEKKNELDLK